MDADMKLHFLGGASSIGGSATLLQVGDCEILVDCGIRMTGTAPLPDLEVLSGRRLDAILVTHAHTDHTGALPVIHSAFPNVPVYMTPPTLDLVAILLADALKLMQFASEREYEIPLYGEAQVESLLQAVQPVPMSQGFEVRGLRFTFLPAGHILGAAMIHGRTPAGDILLTGDFSVTSQLTVPALDRPRVRADLVVCESTYGDRLHSDMSAARSRLISQVANVSERGGRVLIPAFAIGRSQEVLLILKRAIRSGRLPEIPVFVDGMVRRVCGVYSNHPAYVTRSLLHDQRRDSHPFFASGIAPVSDYREREKILAKAPCIVVASSGMLAGGASEFYARHFAPCQEDAILITGYQDEESPGRALLDLAGLEGERHLRLGGGSVPVKCAFDTYSLSAHADRTQITGLLEVLRPRTVILVHGDAEAKRRLGSSLSCGDVIMAEDGMTLSRRFPSGRGSAPPSRDEQLAASVSAAQAEAVLSTLDVDAVGAKKVAAAFFGEGVSRPAADRLADRLIELGFASRDDTKRGLLWLETGKDENDGHLVERLKRENPKGRLLEICNASGLDHPIFQTVRRGGRFACRVDMVIGERTVAAELDGAPDEKSAEQLAAEKLIATELDPGQKKETAVGERESAILSRRNPKGRLLEFAAAARLTSPTFEAAPSALGTAVRCAINLGPERILSGWFSAKKTKTAEQAAAAALLDDPRIAQFEPSGRQGEVEAGTANRLVDLNSLRQRGLIIDFGFEIEAAGDPHTPRFTGRAWAQLGDGRTIWTAVAVEGRKKELKRICAEALYETIIRDSSLF